MKSFGKESPEYQAALDANLLAAQYWEQIKHAQEKNDHDPLSARALRSLVPPGLYEHWKSTEGYPMFYAVDGVIPGVAALPPIVGLMALYGAHAGESIYRPLLDPQEGFWGPMDRADDPEHPYEGPRFLLVRSLSAAERTILAGQADKITSYSTRSEVQQLIERLFPRLPITAL